MSTNWRYFPQTSMPPKQLLDVVAAFDANHDKFASPHNKLNSNSVLACVANNLERAGFDVERGKSEAALIKVPVLYGENGIVEKFFCADAFHPSTGTVVEVEAGRATVNFQFLKDFYESCMMQDAQYLCIAVRNLYEGGGAKSKDYEKVVLFFTTLFASERMQIPLRGIMIIGY